MGQARISLLPPPRHEGTLATRLAHGNATCAPLPRVSSTRPAFQLRRAAIRPPIPAARRAHSLPPPARLANAAGRCLTCRSTGASTACRPGRDALVVHVAPRGQGAMPFRPGYLYVRQHMGQARVSLPLPARHEGTLAFRLALCRPTCSPLPRVSSTRPAFPHRRAAIRPLSPVARRAHSLPLPARLANAAGRCLTCRSTGRATARHPGREALSAYHPPRGQGAMPPRAGYLYVRPHSKPPGDASTVNADSVLLELGRALYVFQAIEVRLKLLLPHMSRPGEQAPPGGEGWSGRMKYLESKEMLGPLVSAVVRRPGTDAAGQAPGARPLRVAAGDSRRRGTDAGAAVHAARRHRLAHAGAHAHARTGGLSAPAGTG